MVLRLQSDLPFFTIGLGYAALFAGVTTLVVSLLASFFVGVARDVVVGAALALVTMLFVSQFIYHDIFTTFYTVFSAMHAGQVVEFGDDVVGKGLDNAGWLVLLAVPLIIFVGVRTSRRGARVGWRQRGITAGLAVALLTGTLLAISWGDRGQNSAYDTYYGEGDPVASVDRLGLMTTMRLDLTRTLLGSERRPAPPPAAMSPRDPTPRGQVGNPSPPPASGQPADPGRTAGAAPTPVENALDIDFERLMAEADSDELRNMHLYFSGREPTRTNEATGMFKGYNFVFLTAEAYSHYAVNPVLTPTLHKMTRDGFSFTDFYNPLWGVSTSDGEYVATTGLIPKSRVWSMVKSGDNAMPLAMGNQLRRLGYATYAYHNHTYDYYGRDISHPNLGYEYKGVGNGLKVAKTWPESDVEMIDVTTPEVLQNEPFHAYYMTVSGHLEYNFGGNFIAAKNRSLVAGLPYGDAARAYLATQIELDRALELLMDRLEEAGVAERTFIVLSADHYPYGLPKKALDELAGHQVESNFELFKSSLIIYAKGMQPRTITEPVSSLDIIPTISNLMGLEFDSRLLMGRDIFSEADPLVIFNNRSFITDKGRYNSMTREFTPRPGRQVPGDYVQAISEEIDRRFYYSARILDRDYYRVVVAR